MARLSSAELSVKARVQPRKNKGQFKKHEDWTLEEEDAYKKARENKWLGIFFPFEVSFWNSYKEKDKRRKTRYELRCVVWAMSEKEAVDMAFKRIGSDVSSDYMEFLTNIDVFQNHGATQVRPNEVYRTTRFLRHDDLEKEWFP